MNDVQERVDSEKIIIFFDGLCNLCSSVVSFLIKRDKRLKFFYSPLQSEVAKQKLQGHQEYIDQLSTLVVLYQEKIYTQSDAVILIANHLDFPWKLIKFLKIIPKFVRDVVYGIVSRFRYRIFGKRQTCRLPTAEERKQFL